MELEKVPNFTSDRRHNQVSSGSQDGVKKNTKLDDAKTDHALTLLLQALSDMGEAQETKKKKTAAEFSRKDIVSAVDMFFETILSSDRCSTAVKNLIGLLQVPILKSAAKNGKFFSDNRHPARRLIKALYLQASKIEHAAALDTHPLYASLLDIVKTVVKEFDGDERIFLRAYFDVCQLP